MNKLYNYLIIMALLITVVFWMLPLFDAYWFSDKALDLLSANGWGAFIPNPSILYWPLLLFWVVVSIGLLGRMRILRTVYLYGLIVFSIANFGWGFQVFTPIEAGLNNIVTLLDGAILVMSYFTSIANEFVISPNKAPQPTPKIGAAEL